MRDPNRIHRIIRKMERVWKSSPDQRLGQLISNLLGPGRHDVFYTEDTVWEDALDNHNPGQFVGEYKEKEERS